MRPLALGGAAPGPGAMSTVCFTLTRNFFVACWQVQRNEECELLEHLAYAYSSQGRFQRTIQLQNEITVIAKELGDKANKLYNKDLYECIGFSNGFKPENDLKANGMFNLIVMTHLF